METTIFFLGGKERKLPCYVGEQIMKTSENKRVNNSGLIPWHIRVLSVATRSP